MRPLAVCSIAGEQHAAEAVLVGQHTLNDPVTDRENLRIQIGDAYRVLPLSAELNGASLKLLRGTVDIFADDPEKVTGKSEAGGDPTTVTSRVGKAMADAKGKSSLDPPTSS